MRFDRSIITAPIGRPVPMPGGVPRQKTPVSITRPSDLEFGRLQERLALLENREIPTFDPTALQQGIAGLQDKFSALPKFDDSILRDRIRALESREIPVFDPSELKTSVAGLQERISNIPQFDPSQLQEQIQANRDLLSNIPQFDDSALQTRLANLEGRELPTFNPEDFRDQFLSIAREGIDIPQPTAPDLSGFARLEDIPTFDREELIKDIRSSINIPKPPSIDREALIEDIKGGLNIPKFNKEALIEDIRSGINIPKPPAFDREKLIEDIRGGLNIPKPPSIDRDALIADIQNRIKLPEPLQPFDPSGLQSRLGDLEKRLADLSAIQPLKPVDPIVGQPGQIEPVSIPIVEPEPIQVPEPLPTRPPSIGGIGGINQDPRPLERPIIPPKRDDFMSIDRLPDQRDRVFPGGSPTFNERGETFVPPSASLSIFDTEDFSNLTDEDIRRRVEQMDYSGMPDSVARKRQRNIERMQQQRAEQRAQKGLPAYEEKVQDVVPTTDPVATPATVAPGGGTDPVTTISEDTRGQVDPVLAQQDTRELQTDPLLRALYFGTADQPGFINQLQQATANLIGSDVPLQGTAGLSDLEQMAQDRALADLGVAEPFVGESADLIRGATREFDPSMTQQFFNPFENQVVQQTIQDVLEAGEKRDVAQRARDIQTGGLSAFGSRARLTAADRQEALGRGLAEALGGIRQAGFGQAQRDALTTFAQQRQAEQQAARDLGQVGTTLADLRARERAGLAGFGQTGRGIEETALSRLFQQQLDQQGRPLQALQITGSLLPQFQAGSTQIDSQYRLPTDPSAAGLGAAFNAYAALAPKQGAG